VSFRVSDDEFRALTDVCLSRGFPSYSDLVRTAVHELLSNRGGLGLSAVQGAVESLSKRIDLLESDLKEVIQSAKKE